jgi:hypothetical protein
MTSVRQRVRSENDLAVFLPRKLVDRETGKVEVVLFLPLDCYSSRFGRYMTCLGEYGHEDALIDFTISIPAR